MLHDVFVVIIVFFYDNFFLLKNNLWYIIYENVIFIFWKAVWTASHFLSENSFQMHI